MTLQILHLVSGTYSVENILLLGSSSLLYCLFLLQQIGSYFLLFLCYLLSFQKHHNYKYLLLFDLHLLMMLYFLNHLYYKSLQKLPCFDLLVHAHKYMLLLSCCFYSFLLILLNMMYIHLLSIFLLLHLLLSLFLFQRHYNYSFRLLLYFLLFSLLMKKLDFCLTNSYQKDIFF